MILNSRNYFPSSEKFRDDFLNTLTPGVIARSNFIQWNSISLKSDSYKAFFDFFKQIHESPEDLQVSQFADALMSADTTMDFVKTAFELLGHTGDNYVSNEDFVDFKKFSEAKKTEEQMKYIAQLLFDLGLFKILKFELYDYFTGIQVGLETHRRKNIGGDTFSLIMNEELIKVVDILNSKNIKAELLKEAKISFLDGTTTKTVDYCIATENKKVGVEVNFYTSSGSKPTEIKRSYGLINSELSKVNTLLVWVTDGIGYQKMRRSLKEARDIHKNIYNLNMFKNNFIDDIYKYFSQ